MNYLKMDKEDVCNGEGLRIALWLPGCSHKCKGCQNPQTWDANSGIPFDESAKEELFRELDKDYISGLTLTGGDPLHEANLDGVLNLVNEFRLSFPQKSIWLYTGFYWEEIFEPSFTEQSQEWIGKYLKQCKIRKRIISQCDVLIDGRYIESQRDITLPYRGSINQRLIDIKKTLQAGEIVLWQT